MFSYASLANDSATKKAATRPQPSKVSPEHSFSEKHPDKAQLSIASSPSYSFAKLPIFAPDKDSLGVQEARHAEGVSASAKNLPSGSTALDAGLDTKTFVGDNGTPTQKSPSPPPTHAAPSGPGQTPAKPTPPATSPATPTSPTTTPSAPTTTANPLAITTATVKTAPSGAAKSRTRVGVGEQVDLTGSAAGTWTANIGTATGASSSTFRWTAPATKSDATATITLTAGKQTATQSLTVVPPKTISMKNVGSHTALVKAGGACMLTEVTFGPSDVCLGAMQWLEVPGPGTGVSGFFKKFSATTLHHDPNPNPALVNDNNVMEAGPHNAANDHCAVHSTPGPYSDGAFQWDIPNQYVLDGEAASSGRNFTPTTQTFTMNAAGTMLITKAGAHT
jgi:hypothetical protein